MGLVNDDHSDGKVTNRFLLRSSSGGRVAFRLRAEAGRADLPQAPAGAGLQWAALRRRWPQPAPLIY